MTKLLSFVRLARPKHYVKNVLVFVPLVYSQNMASADMLLSALVCFAAFCLLASGIYAVNDIADCEKDRAHPINKTRPIAAGKISKRAASSFATICIALSFSLFLLFGGGVVLLFGGLYLVLNLAYTFKLKHFPIIDCFCIAAGFLLRIYAGGAAIGEGVSEWLFLTITAGSLFMAFGKRRGEMLHLSRGGEQTARKVLAGYDMGFLNGIMFACSGVAVVFYALWAMTSTPLMIYTVPLFIFIICKYLLNVHNEKSFGDPVSVIFSDKVLVGAVALLGILSILFLYKG